MAEEDEELIAVEVTTEEEFHVEALDQLCRNCLTFHDDSNLVDRHALAKDFQEMYKIVAGQEEDGIYPPNVCKACAEHMKKRIQRVLPTGPYTLTELPEFSVHKTGCKICQAFKDWSRGIFTAEMHKSLVMTFLPTARPLNVAQDLVNTLQKNNSLIVVTSDPTDDEFQVVLGASTSTEGSKMETEAETEAGDDDFLESASRMLEDTLTNDTPMDTSDLINSLDKSIEEDLMEDAMKEKSEEADKGKSDQRESQEETTEINDIQESGDKLKEVTENNKNENIIPEQPEEGKVIEKNMTEDKSVDDKDIESEAGKTESASKDSEDGRTESAHKDSEDVQTESAHKEASGQNDGRTKSPSENSNEKTSNVDDESEHGTGTSHASDYEERPQKTLSPSVLFIDKTKGNAENGHSSSNQGQTSQGEKILTPSVMIVESNNDVAEAESSLEKKRSRFMEVLSMSAKYEQPPPISMGSDMTLDMEVEDGDPVEIPSVPDQLSKPLARPSAPTKKRSSVTDPPQKRDQVSSLDSAAAKRTVWTCTACGVCFPQQAKLISHAISAHKFQCRSCRTRFSTKAELKEHVNTWHADAKPPGLLDKTKTPVIKLNTIVTSEVDSGGGDRRYRCVCRESFDSLDQWIHHASACPQNIIPKSEPEDTGYGDKCLESVDDDNADENSMTGQSLDDLSMESQDETSKVEKNRSEDEEKDTRTGVKLKLKLATKAQNEPKKKKAPQEYKKKNTATKVTDSKSNEDKPIPDNISKKKKVLAYKCGVCGQLFKNRDACTKHANNCSLKKCQTCLTEFDTEQDRDSHVTLCDGRVRCVRCRKRMPTAADEALHHPIMSTPIANCPVCNANVKFNTLTRHMDTVHGGIVEVYACDLCDVEVDRHVLMEKHLLVHMQDRRWYACDICTPGIWTVDKRAFNLHLLNSHLTPVRFACNFCPKLKPSQNLKSREQWAEHFHVAHNQCATCRRKFKSSGVGPRMVHTKTCCLALYSEKSYFEEMPAGKSPVVPVYSNHRDNVRTSKKKSKDDDKDYEPTKEEEEDAILDDEDNDPDYMPEDAKPVKEAAKSNSPAVSLKLTEKAQNSHTAGGTSSVLRKHLEATTVAKPETVPKTTISKVQSKKVSAVKDATPTKVVSSKTTSVAATCTTEAIKPAPLEQILPIVGDKFSLPSHDEPRIFGTLLDKLQRELPSSRGFLNERECSFCHLRLSTNVAVAVHMLLVHTCYSENDDLFSPFIKASEYAITGKAVVKGRFRCTMCGLILVDVPLGYLLRHAMECCKCLACNKKFPAVELLEVHLEESSCGLEKRKHVFYPRLKCRICASQGKCVSDNIDVPNVFTVATLINHLQDHIVKVGEEESIVQCQVCLLKFNDRDECVRHLSTHTDVQPYCFTCDEFCSSLSEYSHHLLEGNKFHKNKQPSCWRCSFKAQSETEMRQHMLENHVCDQCGSEFDSEDLKKKHIPGTAKCLSAMTLKWEAALIASDHDLRRYVCHFDEIRSLEKKGDSKCERNQCRTCGRMFLNKAFLMAHIKRRHPSMDCCQLCDHLGTIHNESTSAFIRMPLQLHQSTSHKKVTMEMNIQKGLVLHQCFQCNYACTSARILEAHERVTHKYDCPQCWARFKTLKDLYIHSHEMHKESGFRCDECFCVSKTAGALTLHRETHQHCRYLCTYCDSSFVTLEEAKEHAANKHDFETRMMDVPRPEPESLSNTMKEDDSDDKGPQMCIHCGEVFDSTDIASHERRCLIDVKLAEIPCTKCNETFQSDEALKRHMKIHVTVHTQGTQTNQVVDLKMSTPQPTAGTTTSKTPHPTPSRKPSKTPAPKTPKQLPDSGSHKRKHSNSKKSVTGGKKKPKYGDEFVLSETSDSGGSDDIQYDDSNEPAQHPDVSSQMEEAERQLFEEDYEEEEESGDEYGASEYGGAESPPGSWPPRQNVEYSCAACESDPNKPSRFSSLDLLNTHMEQVHNSVPEFDENLAVRFEGSQQLPGEKFSCKACQKFYSTKAGLVYHQKSVHGIERPTRPREPKEASFICGMCSKTYTSKAGFVYHMKTAHMGGSIEGAGPVSSKDGILECEVCNRKFTSTTALWKHSQLHD